MKGLKYAVALCVILGWASGSAHAGDDLQAIQGEWRQTSLWEHNKLFSDGIVIIEGNDLQFGETKLEIKSIREDANPKEIDLTLENRTFPGIYKVEGDRLVIVFSEEVRPANFDESTGKSMHALGLFLERSGMLSRSLVGAARPVELAALQGKWYGTLTPGGQTGEDVLIDIQGDLLTVTSPDGLSQMKHRIYNLRTEKAQHEIDLVALTRRRGDIFPGIYRLDKGALTVMLPGCGDEITRPRSFESSGSICIVKLELKKSIEP